MQESFNNQHVLEAKTNPVRHFEEIDAFGHLEIALEKVDEWLEQGHEVTQGEVMSIIRKEFEHLFDSDLKYPVGEMMKAIPKCAKAMTGFWVGGKPNDLEYFFALSGLYNIVQDDICRRMKTYGSL